MNSNVIQLREQINAVIGNWYSKSGLPVEQRVSVVINTLMQIIHDGVVTHCDFRPEEISKLLADLWDVAKRNSEH